MLSPNAQTLTAAIYFINERPSPVVNFEQKFAVFPPAAKERLILKEANTFVGNAIHLFSHHATPPLDLRRKEVLASGQIKKKFPKAAKQLWSEADKDEKEFWEHEAWRLRDGLKKEVVTAEKVLRDAGEAERWGLYAAHAEIAVARYLQIEPLGWVRDVLAPRDQEAINPGDNLQAQSQSHVELEDDRERASEAPKELALVDMLQRIFVADLDKKDRLRPAPAAPDLAKLAFEKDISLDTFPESLAVEQKTVYGNFAQLYPYSQIRQSEGWKRTSYLCQLADLLDPEGRELFYYYAIPHLWLSRPSPIGMTIMSEAHEVWQFMSGAMRKGWKAESVVVKKLLGDGSLEGLERLQLDGRDEVVFRLSRMVEKAVEANQKRKYSNM